MSDRPKILITGATGFIGRHVVNALQGKADVVPASLGGARVDLTDAAARRAMIRSAGADILIHLAWVTEHGAFWHSPLNAVWEEVSEALFTEFLDAGGRRILGTGSCAEYDWTGATDRIAEASPLAPHTEYGAAKVRTAERLEALATQHGAAWAWGRVFFSFGPGEPAGRLVPLMLRAVVQGTELGIGPGDAIRDFWPVESLGTAIAALALSGLEGPVNLGSGVGTRFGTLADTIERLAGTQGLIRPGCRPLGAGEPMSLVPDVRLLAGVMGAPLDADLEPALARYLAHLRAAAP